MYVNELLADFRDVISNEALRSVAAVKVESAICDPAQVPMETGTQRILEEYVALYGKRTRLSK